MLHCLTHPSCNLYKINLWKKKCCETTFFPCYPVFYISNFPPLPYPLKCPPIYYSNDPLRTFRRNQNAKFKICEWKRRWLNDDYKKKLEKKKKPSRSSFIFHCNNTIYMHTTTTKKFDFEPFSLSNFSWTLWKKNKHKFSCA